MTSTLRVKLDSSYRSQSSECSCLLCIVEEWCEHTGHGDNRHTIQEKQQQRDHHAALGVELQVPCQQYHHGGGQENDDHVCDGPGQPTDKINSNICTKATEVNLSAFIYRLFHKDVSSIVGINPVANSTIHVPYTQQFGGEPN